MSETNDNERKGNDIQIVRDVQRVKKAILSSPALARSADLRSFLAMRIDACIEAAATPGMIRANAVHIQEAREICRGIVRAIESASVSDDSIVSFQNQLQVQVDNLEIALASALRSAGSADAPSIGSLVNLDRLDERALSKLQQEVMEKLARLRKEGQSFESYIKAQQLRLERQFEQSVDRFNQLETERSANYAQKIIQIQDDAARQVSEAQANLQSEIEAIRISAEEQIRKGGVELSETAAEAKKIIEAQLVKVETLVKIISNTSMAGNFKSQADAARRTGRFWQALAVVALAGLVIFTATSYADYDASMDWIPLVSKGLVTISLIVLAAFSVRQLDRYHETEKSHRRYELELSAVDPYLTGLPDSVKNEVKVKLAEKFFGNTAEGVALKAEVPQYSIDLVKAILDTVASYNKKD
ncbi:apolipoprotein A-I [Microcystis phage vB_MaeS-yong1]|nr:apolipoprotein A-I [Microcystis phage vB_MaeS-yong1]